METLIRHFVSISLLALLTSNSVIAQTTEPESLVVNVDTPVIETGTRPAGRSFMRLPSLNYQFDLATRCPAALAAKSISLNIADTRKSLTADEISSEETTSVSMTIPASQIGPIAIDGFCSATGDKESLRIPAVLSVQAALFCANDEDSKMIYASRSLDVTLLCKTPESEPQKTSQ